MSAINQLQQISVGSGSFTKNEAKSLLPFLAAILGTFLFFGMIFFIRYRYTPPAIIKSMPPMDASSMSMPTPAVNPMSPEISSTPIAPSPAIVPISVPSVTEEPVTVYSPVIAETPMVMESSKKSGCGCVETHTEAKCKVSRPEKIAMIGKKLCAKKSPLRKYDVIDSTCGKVKLALP